MGLLSVRQLQPPGTHLLVWGEGEKPSGGCCSHTGVLRPQRSWDGTRQRGNHAAQKEASFISENKNFYLKTVVAHTSLNKCRSGKSCWKRVKKGGWNKCQRICCCSCSEYGVSSARVTAWPGFIASMGCGA